MRLFKVILLASAAGLVCLAAGFGLGQWMACASASCSFDPVLFEGVGTWVGGLATAAAVGFAGYELAMARHRDAESQGRLMEMSEAAARRVQLSFGYSIDRDSAGDRTIPAIEVQVANANREQVAYSVEVEIEGYGGVIWDKLAAEQRQQQLLSLQFGEVPMMAPDWKADDLSKWMERWPATVIRFEIAGYRWTHNHNSGELTRGDRVLQT